MEYKKIRLRNLKFEILKKVGKSKNPSKKRTKKFQRAAGCRRLEATV